MIHVPSDIAVTLVVQDTSEFCGLIWSGKRRTLDACKIGVPK